MSTKTYTVFCCNVWCTKDRWIEAIEVPNDWDLDQVNDAARERCAEAWEVCPTDIQCVGIAEGTVNILYWKDV